MITAFIIFIIFGVIFLVSSRWNIDPQIRANMPPADIEIIQQELDRREEIGVLLLLFAAFALIFILLI